jgi:hypothetical protein
MMATQLPNLTYTLHKSLYIPLTSRSNTLTLPVTRGPQFVLPAHVVAALCRLRDVEHDTMQWKHWCLYLDTQDHTRQALPPSLERVPCFVDDNHPMLSRIISEVQQELSSASSSSYESIVFAGEGEPTLRFPLLMNVARQVATYGLPMRLVTNGLLVHKHGDSDKSDNGPMDVMTAKSCEQLSSCGISSVSVAMMTADPLQYNTIMQPLLGPLPSRDTETTTSTTKTSCGGSTSSSAQDSSAKTAHDRVCQFIQSAVQVGLQVETTGVDRPDVDKEQAEALSLSLGVTTPFRWRPYFP